MMRVQVISCPNCGADLDLTKRISFCPYCGSSIHIDDEVQRVEKTININKNTYSKHERIERDEARIKEAEVKLKIKEQEAKSDSRLLLGIGIFFVLMILFAGIMGLLENRSHANDINIQTAAKQYQGLDYKTVIIELEGLGFENIETMPVPSKLFKKENTIERISINGDSEFEKNTYFPKDAVVIITYYSKDS